MKATFLLLMVLFSVRAENAQTHLVSAPLPVKRPAPLLSPKHASVTKATPMFRVASTGNPVLPMIPFYRAVQSEYGRIEFNAQALQPANQSILFEFSTDLQPGTWVGLAWFGPYPSAQQVFAGLTSDRPTLHIRATTSPVVPTGMARTAVTPTGEIRLNPDVRGAKAWRGLR